MIACDYRNMTHRYPVSVGKTELSGNVLTLDTTDNLGGKLPLRITFYKEGVIGVNFGKKGTYKPEYDFVEASFRKAADKVTAETTEEALTVHYEGYTLTIGLKAYSVTVTDKSGSVICTEAVDDLNPVGDGKDIIPPIGYTESEGKLQGSNIAYKLRYDEHIYGLGERFTEFDKRGQRVLMKNQDTLGCRDQTAYKNIPFYLSSYKYGLFVNSHLMTQFNIGYESTSTISIHHPAEGVEYFLLLGGSLKEIVSKFTRMTGPATLPPDWSFGLWYSTSFKDSSREAVEADAAALRKKDIPASVFHFDCYWLRDDMWCDFVWDDDMYPDRIGMLRGLKEKGFKVCLWINPYVTIKTEMFKEGDAKGYFVKDKSGKSYLADLWHGLLSLCAIVDFTNPEATKWYQEKVVRTLAEGVDALKTDFGENIPLDCVFSNGHTGEQMRNIYADLYNKAVFETIEKEKGKGNTMVWGRSGFAGMQKYPVCWSGDPRSSWECMGSTLRAGLSLGVSGVPFWSHDMGGFYGNVTNEVYVRWSQFGFFSSHCRLHGTTTRQPWAFGERAEAIIRDFSQLRYKLMPYILQTAKDCAKAGIPFIRPLVLEHEDDPTVATIYDQYYFGKDMMVAPVFGGDNAKRKIYLPEGEWEDLLTKKKYAGKQWIEVTAPLEYLPVFIRDGAKIPME